MGYSIPMNLVAENFLRSPSEGVAEGGLGEESATPERSAERSEAVMSDFVFRFMYQIWQNNFKSLRRF